MSVYESIVNYNAYYFGDMFAIKMEVSESSKKLLFGFLSSFLYVCCTAFD